MELQDNQKIELLEEKIGELEKLIRKQNDAIQSFNTLDVAIPKTDMLSENFLKRSFTVWGHYFVAQLIISLFVAAVFSCWSGMLSLL